MPLGLELDVSAVYLFSLFNRLSLYEALREIVSNCVFAVLLCKIHNDRKTLAIKCNYSAGQRAYSQAHSS
jgi:hypothetical protein